MKDSPIVIYTDGSCNPKYKIGAWAAILFLHKQRIVLSGNEEQTTHQRMELTAVIKAFEYLAQANATAPNIMVFTDSQYVAGIPARSSKLTERSFVTRGGMPIHNNDLLQLLIASIEKMKPVFVKVKAHQQVDAQNINHEVDKLSRKLAREAVEQIKKKE